MAVAVPRLRHAGSIARELALWPMSLKVGSTIVATIVLAGLFAPLIAPYDPFYQDFASALQAPSLAHPFGTDMVGRDVFSRVLYGIRIDMQIGFFTTYVPMIYGVALGAAAGYFGGWFDAVIMRLLDIAMAFPFLVLIIVILSILGPGVQNIYIAVFLVAWTMYARLARAEMLVERRQGLHSGRAYPGFWPWAHHLSPRIAQHHQLLDHLLDGRLRLNILLVSGLSFLGLGVQPPLPEWGAMIAEGRDFILQAWWISTLPGVVVVITGTGLSLIGDGLAHRLGERQRSLL